MSLLACDSQVLMLLLLFWCFCWNIFASSIYGRKIMRMKRVARNIDFNCNSNFPHHLFNSLFENTTTILRHSWHYFFWIKLNPRKISLLLLSEKTKKRKFHEWKCEKMSKNIFLWVEFPPRCESSHFFFSSAFFHSCCCCVVRKKKISHVFQYFLLFLCCRQQ